LVSLSDRGKGNWLLKLGMPLLYLSISSLMSNIAMWNLPMMKRHFIHPMLVLEKIYKNWCFVNWRGEKDVGSGHLSGNITYGLQPSILLLLYAQFFYLGLLIITTRNLAFYNCLMQLVFNYMRHMQLEIHPVA
jgi:hypothetical protein